MGLLRQRNCVEARKVEESSTRRWESGIKESQGRLPGEKEGGSIVCGDAASSKGISFLFCYFPRVSHGAIFLETLFLKLTLPIFYPSVEKRVVIIPQMGPLEY
ncbi:hypothetical protein TNIN_267391 [Trichonephila inaurata madagascariensis]|uniref:Uncharacterized protein n=1 Tax=Trichonephila inaurata madagascariensis TaxID=2747483 RepID=A0A8X6KEA1_9ARAC|nr:hypothetical protein TNIN_267391 [Trichonephila inaurata madagascariensis]